VTIGGFLQRVALRNKKAAPAFAAAAAVG